VRGHRVRLRLQAELHLAGLAAWRGLVRFLSGNDLTHAASIAYYALLSLFPFLLLILSILGAATADEQDRLAVLNLVFRYFPTRLDFVTGQLDGLRQRSVQVGVAGGLGLMWASLGVFGAITSAVNEAWGVAARRGFWKHRAVSFLMLLAAGLAILTFLVVVSALEVAQASSFGVLIARVPWLVGVQALVLRYVASILLTLAVGLMFYFLPNARVRFRDVWVGALVTAVLWTFAFDGFSWYIGWNRQLQLIHGSITAAVVFLLWMYVSAIILIYGVEFTAAHARLRRGRRETAPAAPPLD
jgi:membrane protein